MSQEPLQDKLQLGYSNFTLRLMYFANDHEIRIFTDSGDYVIVKQLYDLPTRVAELIKASAESSLRKIKEHLEGPV